MATKPNLTDDQAENLDALARDRRQVRFGPSAHRLENERSIRKAMRKPRGFDALLAWFLDGWAAETPEAIHRAGVWVGRATKDEDGEREPVPPPEHLGGSLLGTPETSGGMRSLVENKPGQVDHEKPAEYDGPATPYFVRPMRAALARMAGVGAPDRPSALMAANLRRLANAGGDWRGVGFSIDVYSEHVAYFYWLIALERLFNAWSTEPEARPIGH